MDLKWSMDSKTNLHKRVYLRYIRENWKVINLFAPKTYVFHPLHVFAYIAKGCIITLIALVALDACKPFKFFKKQLDFQEISLKC